jgi:cytochrome c peroxidase
MRFIGFLLIGLSFLLLNFISKPTATPYQFPTLPYFPKMPTAANNPVTIEGANLGRYLFYDPILSIDSTMACASCHKQQYAFSDAPNAFSKGRNQTLLSRNTMPLYNLAWYPAFFWDGRASNLETQIFHPVRAYNEMNLDWKLAEKRLTQSKFYKKEFAKIYGNEKIDSNKISKVIAQFLRTLISYQSKYDKVITGKGLFTKDEYDGFVLANDQTMGDCLHCHTTDSDALGTQLVFSNNGLDTASHATNFKDAGRGAITGKATDNGKFKVPSLRNLAFTAPYMHDGRFKTLEEVIDFYSEGVKKSVTIDSKMQYVHRGGVKLNKDEKRKIIAFLLTLSDSSFISNTAFSNPFNKN